MAADAPSVPPTRSPLPPRLSPSALDRYRRCPRSLYLQMVVRVPREERPSPHLVLGNAVHAALSKFFGLAPALRSEEVLHRCLRAVWREHRRPGAFATVTEERLWGERGLALLSAFHDNFDTSAVPLARERWLSWQTPDGIELYGKLDRVDGVLTAGGSGELEVIDYKTGRQVIEDDDLPTESSAQVYLLAAEARYGRPVSRVRYIHLDGAVESRWEPEREDVDAARERILALVDEAYADREFEARPGAICRFCPVAHACPDADAVSLDDLEVADDIAF